MVKVRTRNGEIIDVPEATAARLVRKKRGVLVEAVRPPQRNAAMRTRRGV